MHARWLALPFLLLLGAATWQEAPAPPVELELTYLANEGFLLAVGTQEILIDAFVGEPYGGYAVLPAELKRRLLAGEAPFAALELALASHHHRDHFQAELAAEFVRAQPQTRFLSSPQVVDALRAVLGADPAAARLEALLPEPGALAAEETCGVELLRLPHTGGARTRDVQNLGHLLTLGGARLLHVGDADGDSDELEAYDLAQRELDVVLVPYWWLGDAAALARVRARTGAAHLVAMHVPPAELAEVKQRLARLDPAVLLFERAGETRKLVLAR